MNNYKFLYLFWLLPLALALLTAHQLYTYYSIVQTYNKGQSYTAEVMDFEIKQIAAQTNGYVVLKFKTREGKTIQKKLSLSVTLASQFMESNVIPVRYYPDSSTPIVMIKTYNTHSRIALINASMAFLFFVALFIIAFFVHRFAKRKINETDTSINIVRTDG